MSCCRKIEPDPRCTRHFVPGKICPGVKITAQLLNELTLTILRTALKIENGLINGRTMTGPGSTTPKYLMRTSSHPAAKGMHERTMTARRRDFMGEPR